MTPAIVFDIGNVLITVRHDTFHQYLLENGVAVRSLEQFQKAIRLFDYECGRISCDKFFGGLCSMLENNVSVGQLSAKWNSMFAPIDEMLDLLHTLRASHRVYLLSNTNEMHWKFLCKRYALDKAVHAAIVSFRAGVMKPDPRIYRYFMDELSLSPEEIIFLDDRPENVEAAHDAGWRAIHHFSFEDSRLKLLDFGVDLPIRPDPIQ